MVFKKYADFLLILVAISWGATFLLVKNAIEDLPAFSFLSARFFLAFLLMYILFFKKITIDMPSIKASIILGVFNFIAYALQTVSLYFLPSNIVAFLTGLFVVLTPIISIFFHKTISKKALIASIIAFIGIYFLNNAKFELSIYEILVILCALFYALHINFTDIYSKKYNIFTLVTFQFLTVALLSALFIPFESGFKFSLNVAFALFVTVVFATVFAFFVQTFAQQFTTPTKTAIIFALEPLTAAVIGAMYGESLSIKEIFGGILIIISMILAEI